MSLLEQFIKEKVEHYNEPSRMGTPKGEPIGFSRRKYAAAVACISDKYMYEIADQFNVNYKVLRNWHIETRFQAETDRAAIEGAEFISKWINENIERCQTIEDCRNLIFLHFIDIDEYGDDLKLHLREKLHPLLEEDGIVPRKNIKNIKKKHRKIGERIQEASDSQTTLSYYYGSVHYVLGYSLRALFISFLRSALRVNKSVQENFKDLLGEIEILLRNKAMVEKYFNDPTATGREEEIAAYFRSDFVHHEQMVEILMIK